MYKIALSICGTFLLYVPNSQRSEELCKIAVGQDGNALRHVPKNIMTDDICKSAVSNSPHSISYELYFL